MSQKALNHVLTLKYSGGGPALPESSRFLEKGLIFEGWTPEILQQEKFGPNVIHSVAGTKYLWPYIVQSVANKYFQPYTVQSVANKYFQPYIDQSEANKDLQPYIAQSVANKYFQPYIIQSVANKYFDFWAEARFFGGDG